MPKTKEPTLIELLLELAYKFKIRKIEFTNANGNNIIIRDKDTALRELEHFSSRPSVYEDNDRDFQLSSTGEKE